MTEEIPKYLRERRKKKDRNVIARYRCGNKMRGSQHWREDKERKCRVCKGVEILMHVLKECEATRYETSIEEFLKEDGKSCELMKRIDRIREERRKEKEGVETGGK